MTLRKLIFWLHLTAGSFAGIVVLIMSVTGVLLMYEKQVLVWADRGYRVSPPANGTVRLPIETLIEKGRETKDALPAAVTLRAGAAEPVALTWGREATVYVDPYTGSVLGEGSHGVREFFRIVTDWHRWLGAGVEGRARWRSITGACNLAFLFLVMSGFYLWFPRKWEWQHVRAVTLFRGGLAAKARDFNWHNVIGFWCAVPLFFIVISGVVISYPWAGNLVYRLAGTEPPTLQGGGGRGRGNGPAASAASLNLDGLSDAWTRAEKQVPAWRSISLRLPNSNRAPLAFTIDEGTAGQPQKRSTLTLSRSGEIQRWEPFSSLDAGRRARSWLRFVHTGEYYGIAGQTLAGIASAGAAVLVWTGLSLAFRRFLNWRSRKNTAQREMALAEKA